MPVTSNRATTIRILTWTVRGLAMVEALDAVIYLGVGGWFSANPILIALVAGGLLGAALTWVRRPLSVIGIGGLLVAVAPSIVYPLSALLGVASLGAIALTRLRVLNRGTAPADAANPASPLESR